ncbi:receptor-like serine/threonine-protein kinase NCRK isoform X1 [Silene latifolia]|uniref:receptor-like serine/threonine-protein kinase NCRK isoform X1 n=3 Tax=Silene latifolia TaxID=37657 RepID=UPI003D76ED0B
MLACVLLDVKELLKMKLQVALSSVLILVLIHQVTSQISNTSESSWTCICSTVHQEMQGSIIAGKCSGSCDCGPAVSTGNKWSCICDGGQLPYLATDNLNSDCFTSCNCSSGVVSDAHSPQKHIFSKTVVIILFVCLVLTTLACIASLVWYFYQKDKQRSQKILSEKASSYNSATDLIRHKSLPQPPSRFADSFMTDSFEGCISIASLLFRRKKGKICGAVIHFPYFELEQATNKFSDAKLIGVGGSSHVYSGHLIDGRTIAVKRLKASNELDSDSEFFREVELISRLHHCHIVPLLGYCSLSSGKQSDRLLVFEYMGNGNLRDWLDGATGKYLDWRTRISIALGAAKGLEYLHEAAAPRILHRDVKSTNILLDENWRAKVTDLGMAKRLSTDGSASYSSSPERIQGTFGYFAPEYAIVGKGSLKSDVFSFGVVLLELITGRAPIFSVSNIEESLVLWAAPRLQNSKRVIAELPDPHLNGEFPEEEMQVMAYLAKECLLLDPECRPSMSEVVQVLSTIAPDNSSRRGYSTNFFQNLSLHNARSEQPARGRSVNQVEVVVDSEELKQMCPSRWSSRSLSLDADRNLFADSIAQPINLSAVQYIDRLLHLSATRMSNNTNGGDEVDLTQPRLETFCVENGH